MMAHAHPRHVHTHTSVKGAGMRDATRQELTDSVEALADDGGLIDQLRALLAEAATSTTYGTRTRHKVTGSPAPWNAEAASVYLTIHHGARDLEALLRYLVTGATGPERGGSDANTRAALYALPKLAEAVDEGLADHAARVTAGWVTAAHQSRDIDITDRPVPLPRVPGQLPPACDYCGRLSLRMSTRSGVVFCINPRCHDAEGRRPLARIETGRYTGVPSLVWQDGRNVVYQPVA